MLLEILILVQLVTESLPISSSSHLGIIDLIAQKSGFVMPTLPAYFDHFLHGPMILIIVIFFARRGLFLNKDWISDQVWNDKKSGPLTQDQLLANIAFLLIATSITVCFWFMIKPLKTTSFFMSEWTLLFGLAITTALLFSLRWCGEQKKIRSVWFNALILGVVQGFALLPGISRFASTFVVARWLGYPARLAFRMIFLMELPLVVAGFFWYGLRTLVASGQWDLLCYWSIGGSFVFGSMLAYACLCWMEKLAEQNLFWKWGWYMFLPIGVLIGLMVG